MNKQSLYGVNLKEQEDKMADEFLSVLYMENRNKDEEHYVDSEDIWDKMGYQTYGEEINLIINELVKNIHKREGDLMYFTESGRAVALSPQGKEWASQNYQKIILDLMYRRLFKNS